MNKKLMQIEKLYSGLSQAERISIESFFERLDKTIDLPIYNKTLLIEHFIHGFEYFLDKNYEADQIIRLFDIDNLGDFYTQKNRRYFSLDNAAIVYPLGMKYGQMPMFRLAMELKEDIKPCLLQLALDFTIKRFPLFAAVIKNGFFWHYLETTNTIHLVEEENDIPCKPISIIGRTKSSLRVLYYKKRISVEFFHVLTDGTGGLIFLKSLVGEYLRLNGFEIKKQDGVLDTNEQVNESEFVNEFANAEGKADLSTFVDKKSLQLDGKLSSLNISKIMHYVLDTKQLLTVSKSYNATVTSYLTAIEFLAAKECIREKHGIFNIQIPINMRKFNNSQTLRNYSMYFNASMAIEDIADKRELIENISGQIKEKGTFEQMNHMMMTTRKIISSLSYVPLFIKVPLMQIIYGYLGNSIIGSTLSNLGQVKTPEEMSKQIEKMYFVMAPGKPNRATSTLVSINDKSVFTIIMNCDDYAYLEKVYELLKQDSLDIKLEGSGNYEP